MPGYMYNALVAIPSFIQIVSITLFFYYSILHFDEEVDHIWSQKWTWGKALFFATRYSGVLFNILLLVSMIGDFDKLDMDANMYQGYEVYGLNHSETLACLDGYLYSGMGLASILLAEGILALRVYAIYNKSKRVLVFLMVLLLASLAVNLAQASGILTLAVENFRFIFQGNLAPYEPFGSGGKLMNTSCSYSSQPLSTIDWATTTVVESVLFTMVFVKYQRKGKPDIHTYTTQSNLLAFLAKDSTVYYGITLVCTIIPTVVSFLFETKFSTDGEFLIHEDILTALGYQLNPFQAVVITVMTLLAPQMIINLRRRFYQYIPGDGTGTVVLPGGISFQSQELSWDAQRLHDLEPTTFDASVLDY